MRFLFSTKKFSEPLNTAVLTTIHVMKEGSPIVWVSHELDGDWQFMGNETIEDYRKVAMVVSLESIIQLDKSVIKVADLPMGYCATRNSKSDKWSIAKIEYSEQEMREFGFYCSKCGQYHKEIPMAYGADAPYQYALIPENERENRCTLTQDQCIIDGEQYFIRGQIELPVDDNAENFCWNVWVQVSEHDFEKMGESWEDENRILEKPYSGRIATHLEPYPETIGLPVLVITQLVGYVPKVEVIESNHPLYFEQENGITMERVTAFAKEILYQH
jgi:hypothetical protein